MYVSAAHGEPELDTIRDAAARAVKEVVAHS